MEEQSLLVWLSIVREVVIPLAVIFVAVLLKRKYGIEIDLKKTEQISTVAFDSIMIAKEAAHSPKDPTPNTPEGINQKALKVGLAQLKETDRAQLMNQLEAWVSKINMGAVGAAPQPGGGLALPPVSMPPPKREDV